MASLLDQFGSLTFKESTYTFVEPLPDKYICGICISQLVEPHVTECCGQHFCKECLKKSEPEFSIIVDEYARQFSQIKNRCPHCRQSNFNHIRYLPFKREINSLKMYCPRKSNGCNVRVAYADRKNHEAICEYKKFPCTNGCGEMILNKDMKSHVKNYCSLRNVRCQFCGEIRKYKQIQRHYSKCPEVTIQCQNNCGVQFKRKEAKSHDSLCPEVVVVCDFFETGCRIKLKRKDLQHHNKTNLEQHLHQMKKAYTEIKQENEALKQENTALKQEHVAKIVTKRQNDQEITKKVKNLHWPMGFPQYERAYTSNNSCHSSNLSYDKNEGMEVESPTY